MRARETTIPAGDRTSRLSEAAARVVRLYEAWGKPARAADWREKLVLADLPDDVFAHP
jgi:eukaryotic-like serine/threonine-protein kinase